MTDVQDVQKRVRETFSIYYLKCKTQKDQMHLFGIKDDCRENAVSKCDDFTI